MQRLFRKFPIFKGLVVGLATLLAYAPMHRMPSIPPRPTQQVSLRVTPVELAPAVAPFRLAGAWALTSPDRRVRGISGLAADDGALLAVTDLGAFVRFPPPSGDGEIAAVGDLRHGPGRFGYKINRDAEALVGDGRGSWFVTFEQHHSVWRYDSAFEKAQQVVAIDRGWPRNQGAEAILLSQGVPLVISQDGSEVLVLERGMWRASPLRLSGWEVSDAATAPDGKVWLLLRRVGIRGFENAIAPLIRAAGGYAAGEVTSVPKGWSDNLEGLAITHGPNGLRFWLISDDGHRILARTLLLALDLPQAQESARR